MSKQLEAAMFELSSSQDDKAAITYLPAVRAERQESAVTISLYNDHDHPIQLRQGKARVILRGSEGADRTVQVFALTGQTNYTLKPGATSVPVDISLPEELASSETLEVRFEFFDKFGTYGTGRVLDKR